MSLLVFYMLLSLPGLDRDTIPSVRGETSFVISDSISIEVRPAWNSKGMLDLYAARTLTPVCEGEKCYTIEILLYWDIVGRYHHFDTIPGKGLTRLDHIPFTTADYKKLDSILLNPYSALADYRKEDLVKSTRRSGIDGITGATAAQLKNSIVEGAVYSCYSLWHIVHGPVADSIQKATSALFSKEMVKYLVDQRDPEINYFLIKNFTDMDFEIYLPEVIQSISYGEAYYPKNAIELMPASVICSSKAQESFSLIYKNLDYFARLALLEKLNSKDLELGLRETLSSDIDERNSYKNELLKSLVYPEENLVE